MHFQPPLIEGRTVEELLALNDPNATVLARRLCRRNFEAWCTYRMSKQDRAPALHHRFIINSIQQLLDGTLGKRKLMILCPPGSAKSTYTSVLLPAWYCNPERRVDDLMLSCSYSYTLAENFAKMARDIVSQEEIMLGVELSKTTSAAGNWRVTHQGLERGGLFCAGVNAGIAGRRASLGLIDDYIGSEEDADSELIREKNYHWYHNDFWPRLLPTASVILIANRRHEDDLVGRLLKEEAESWHVVKLPMLAEENDPLGRVPGDRLWPDWFTDEMVQTAKSKPRMWAGLYQQNPRPTEGAFFAANSIRTYAPNELPDISDLRIYAGSDWAAREGQENDYFCHIVGGVDNNSRLWIIDFWWEHANTGKAVDRMFLYQRTYRPIAWWQGRENITGAIAPFLYKMMRDEGVFMTIREFSESKAKETKAANIRAWMESGMVLFPANHPQWESAHDQLLTFPGSTNDDFVDALAKFGYGLNSMFPAVPKPPQIVETLTMQPLTLGWLKRSHKERQRRICGNSHLPS